MQYKKVRSCYRNHCCADKHQLYYEYQTWDVEVPSLLVDLTRNKASALLRVPLEALPLLILWNKQFHLHDTSFRSQKDRDKIDNCHCNEIRLIVLKCIVFAAHYFTRGRASLNSA